MIDVFRQVMAGGKMSVSAAERTDYVNLRPPYPASVAISGPPWHSDLARDGRVFLSRPEVQIGRMGANDVVLSDANVSRHHAVIRWTPRGYVLQDLGSTNGSYVEGHRIEEPVLLVPGQRILIGATSFVFEALQTAQDASPAIQRAPMPSAPAAYPGSRPGVAEQTQGPSASGAVAPRPMAFPGTASAESRFLRWLKRQKGKRYWRVFLVGLAGYIAATIVLHNTDNPHLVPMALLIGSAVVPVAFVRFCVDEGAFADMPVQVVGFTFISGAITGLLLAAILESNLAVDRSPGPWIMVGLAEESAKVAAVAWILFNKRLRSELDGLVIGAAAGMGFAALETAGYGFDAFLQGCVSAGCTNQTLLTGFVGGIDAMQHSIILRMTLALFGHGVWTAIICAAIWRDRGKSVFRLTSGVVLAFGISVGLHFLWDWGAAQVPDNASDAEAVLAQLPIGLLGLFILRFFIRESLQRAALGSMAPPPRPLPQALAEYFAHPIRSGVFGAIVPRPEPLMAAFSAATPVGTGAPQPPAQQPASPGPAPPMRQSASPGPAVPMPGSTCARCGSPDPGAGPFCVHCGARLSPVEQRQEIRCRSCGAPNKPDSRFCVKCGSSLEPE
jgi:RsiW-degrading membrane proteinase PrsW (M82 family)